MLGHENFGVVEEVGPDVDELRFGDYVMAMVRRPGRSIFDQIGAPDLTTDDVYYEHGISLLHGFLRPHYVDTPEYLVGVPAAIENVGVLLEPASIVEKSLDQMEAIQRRLPLWQPRRAAVLGAGSVGLLATLLLRLRGLQVVTMALPEPPYLNSELAEAIGARYLSTPGSSLVDASGRYGPFDLIFEATGYSPLAFETMETLGKNGILVLYSVTGGGREVIVPADLINQSFVLGNKAMVGTVNAARKHIEAAVRDFSLAEHQYPGWLDRMITDRVAGLAAPPNCLLEPSDVKRVIEVR